jgi:hypothetical protein
MSSSAVPGVLRVAQHAAGAEKLDGGLWPAYRRKWATERKDSLLKDVAAAAAGGWKDVTTLLTCYQHADDATMRLLESPVKLIGHIAGDRDGSFALTSFASAVLILFSAWACPKRKTSVTIQTIACPKT